MQAVQPKGRLSFHENGEANSYTIYDELGGWLLSLLHNGEALLERQRVKLRRLVACWNACDGISTEALERTDFIELYRERLRSVRCEVVVNEAVAPNAIEPRFVVSDSDQPGEFCLSGGDERALIAQAHLHYFGF